MAPSRSRRLRDLLRSRLPGAITRRRQKATNQTQATESLEERMLLSATLGPQIRDYQSTPNANRIANGLGQHLTGPQSGEPIQIAIDYLQDNAAQLGIRTDQIDSARFDRIYEDQASGVTHLYLKQQVNGLDVANAPLNINISADGAVINVGSAFVTDVGAPDAVPELDVLTTLSSLVDEFGWEFNGAPDIIDQEDGLSQRTTISPSGISRFDITAELKYVATAEGLDLSWEYVVRTLDNRSWYVVNASAEDGQVTDIADRGANATYQTFALPIESPNSGSRTFIVDAHDLVASPFGWHDTDGVEGAEFTDTRGNNVDAFEDRNGDDAAGDRADGGDELVFAFDWDPALNAEDELNEEATITNLFYWNNIAHDVFYQYGFDEASGNFQTNNYGNGGIGGDAVLAQALDNFDGGDRGNANFFTPPDGQPGEMQMFVFDNTDPTRTSDFDNGVILHEFGHGITNRLTGGANDELALRQFQARSLGEGWSDWFALMALQTPADSQFSLKTIGTYALGNTAGFRDFPYSFDLNASPKTYGDFGSGNGAFAPHPNGEIMAAALWDLNWLMINGDGGNLAGQGYDSDIYNGTGGNNITLRLVMDALKLQPANPTFLDHRDAVLLADTNLTGGANHFAIWSAFARRGMGYSAFGGTADGDFIQEAFDLPPNLLFRVDLAASQLPEDGGTTTGRVQRGSAASVANPLIVTLTNGDPSELEAPTTVTIPAGSTFVNFQVSTVDDTELDGTQTVSLTASAVGVSPWVTSIDVTDVESLTLEIDADQVAENDGENATFVTLTRSNTDTLPSNILVSVGDELLEFDRDGVLIDAQAIPYGLPERPAGETARDLIVTPNGDVAVYNGTSDVFLSRFDPNTSTWNHQAFADLSTSPSIPGSGGIAAFNQFVFLTDMNTVGGTERGLVRFNRVNARFERFAGTVPGDRLFATSDGTGPNGNDLIEIDLITGDIINTLPLPPGVNQNIQDGLAYDGTNLWYIASDIDDRADDLYRLNPDTGAVLDRFDTGITSGIDGIAALNGEIYLLDSAQDNNIVVWDPTAQQVSRILDIDTLNPGLTIAGGLAAGRDPDVLYVTDAFSADIYEIDPITGLVLRPFTRTLGGADLGLGVINGEIYVGANGTNEIEILDRDSLTLNRTLTVPGATGGFESIGADDVQGAVFSPFDFIDMNVGLDELLYALDQDGQTVSVFDPATLELQRFLLLEEESTSIAVDAFGNIFGTTAAGLVYQADSTGVVTNQLATGTAGLIDIDLSLSGDILVSSSAGQVVVTDVSLLDTLEFTAGVGTAFVSFGSAPGRSTGDLTVQIANSDTSEISAPRSVVIPAGSQSVTFPIDAVDDFLLDGTQDVTLSTDAPGYAQTVEDSIAVTDVETLTIDVDRTEVFETDGAGAATITITRSNVDGPFNAPNQLAETNTTVTPILDRDTVISTVEVASQIAFVDDVNVRLSLTHGHLGDLDVFLLSPSGTRVELFTDVGGIGEVIDELILDDQAADSITSGIAPFTGRFQPEQSLAAFNGEVVSGVWTLEITDDTNLEFGELLEWELQIGSLGFPDLEVTIISSDTTEAVTGTTTVTLPANQLSGTVALDAVDDALLDGTQTVILTSTASDYFPDQDSVEVIDAESISITFDRDEIAEDAGVNAAIGTVTRSNDGNLDSALVVTLDNRDGSEINVPDTVTIPAGQTSATFMVDAVDDNVLDGQRRVRVNATATGYQSTSDSRAFIVVTDSEPTLVVDIDDEGAFENEEFITATITRTNTTSLTTSLSVALTSNNANATVPPSITIPAGQASTTFTITLTDNNLLDGDRDVTITASAGGTFPGSGILNLRDFETLSLSISGEFDEADGAGAATGTVTRNNTNIDSDVVVTLTSNDDSELTVPATVTIPAGSSSVDFPIDAVNDDNFDGPQNVLIGISATGYVSDEAVVVVNDHEPTRVTSPDNLDTTLNPRPTVRWRAVEGATSYRIRFRNVTTGEQEFIVEEDLPADITSYTPPRDLPLGNYDIFVGYDDERELAQPESIAVRLRVRTAPEFTAPRALAGTDPVDLAWTAVTDADEYQLVVNDLTRNRQVVNERNLTNTSFAADLEPGVYEAFVRAWGNGIRGTRTRIRFTVLLTPEILTPTAGNSWDRTPTITWTGSEGADHYDVRIHDLTIGLNNGGQNFIRDRFVLGTEFTPETELEIGHRYAIYVSALTEDGLRSLWTNRFVYEVGLLPDFISPTNGGTVSQEPVFRFEEVAESKKYDFRIRVLGGSGNLYRDRNVQSTAVAPDIVLEPGSYTAHVRAVSLFGDQTRWSRVEFIVASSAGLESDDLQLDPESVFLLEDAPSLEADPTTAPVDFAAEPVIINSYVDETTDEVITDEPSELAVPAQEVAVPVGESSEIDSVMEQLPALDAEWWAVGQESPEFSITENLDDLAGDTTPTTIAGAAVLGAALAAAGKRKKRSEER